MCMMALHFKHAVLYREYVNEQEFSGALRQVLPARKVSLYARRHAHELQILTYAANRIFERN